MLWTPDPSHTLFLVSLVQKASVTLSVRCRQELWYVFHVPPSWLRRSSRDCQSASIAGSMIISWPSSALLPLESPPPAQLKQAEPQPVSLTHSPPLQGLIRKTSFEKLFPFNREGNTFSGFSGLNLWCRMCVCICFCFMKKKTNLTFIWDFHTPLSSSAQTWLGSKHIFLLKKRVGLNFCIFLTLERIIERKSRSGADRLSFGHYLRGWLYACYYFCVVRSYNSMVLCQMYLT